MFCPQCGASNADLDRYCVACGTDMTSQAPGNGPTASRQGQYAPPANQQYAQQQYQPPPYQQAPYGSPPSQQNPFQGGPYQTQYQPTPTNYGMPITLPTYLVWAIVTLILCFWPASVVAIVYGSQVNGKLARGDYNGAASFLAQGQTLVLDKLRRADRGPRHRHNRGGHLRRGGQLVASRPFSGFARDDLTLDAWGGRETDRPTLYSWPPPVSDGLWTDRASAASRHRSEPRRGGRVRLIAPVLKTGTAQAVAGSNPAPSASAGMAKPIFSAPVLPGGRYSSGMPMKWPCALKHPPPELPGLIGGVDLHETGQRLRRGNLQGTVQSAHDAESDAVLVVQRAADHRGPVA